MKKIVVLTTAAGLGLTLLFGFGFPTFETAKDRGRLAYAQNCASCHGANLEGQANWQVPDETGTYPAPPHSPDGHTWHHDDDLLFTYTKLGGEMAMANLGITDFKSGMPGFEGVLTDAQINDIWAYIKSTWTDRERNAQAERTAATANES
ncbi:MAG: cytochrome c [Rhodobacteraceae bacterium]|nr:cytochrome c [Paracoccaceae bacterium]